MAANTYSISRKLERIKREIEQIDLDVSEMELRSKSSSAIYTSVYLQGALHDITKAIGSLKGQSVTPEGHPNHAR